jgi:hypothetical protein
MSLYTLLKVFLLLINAFVIINERFLRQIGVISPNNNDAPLDQVPQQHPQQSNSFFGVLTDQNVKMVVQYPLVILNIVFILIESLF